MGAGFSYRFPSALFTERNPPSQRATGGMTSHCNSGERPISKPFRFITGIKAEYSQLGRAMVFVHSLNTVYPPP